MRKQFQSDEEIPPTVWQLFPEYKQKLDRIIEMEEKLGSAVSSRKRICFAINSEPEFKTKILRIHIRHQFHVSTAHDRAHYIISVEGHLLDKSSAKLLPFGNFLDKIRIQLDKRFHPSNSAYEWSAETFPEGVKGHCFRVKVYGDKPFPIKVFLYRSNDIRARCELSPSLREVLPSMQVDPTEEQVLLALWGLLTTNNMMEGRDRRQIKCSNELKNLFGVENMTLSSLRLKVSEHLTPCKAIQVEYNVTNTSSVITTSFSPNAVSKGGGKAFDIEVDVKDPYAFDLLESVNDMTRNQKEILETISMMDQKASFLANAIMDSSNSIFGDLKPLQSNPLSLAPTPSLSGSGSGFAPQGHYRRASYPLLETARGTSSGFSMRGSVPAEVLQRASEPFSLISRRAAHTPAPVRRILRPQRGAHTDLPDPDPVPVAAAVAVSEPITVQPSESAASISAGADVAMSSVFTSEEMEVVAVEAGTSSSDVADSKNSERMDEDADVEGVAEGMGEGADTAQSEEVPAPVPAPINIKQEAEEAVESKAVENKAPLDIKVEKKDEDAAEEEGEGEEKMIVDEEAAADTSEESGGQEAMTEGGEVHTGSSAVALVAVKGEKEGEDGDVQGAAGVVDLVPVKDEMKEETSKEVKAEAAASAVPSSSSSGQAVESADQKPVIAAAIAPVAAVPVVPAPAVMPVILARAPDIPSAIHSLRGFLDVGSDPLFAPYEPWVLATATLVTKRKLSNGRS